jgi:hypothetical protein
MTARSIRGFWLFVLLRTARFRQPLQRGVEPFFGIVGFRLASRFPELLDLGFLLAMRKSNTRKAKSLSTWFRQYGKWFVHHRFTEPHFDAHTKAIGSLLLAWNDFHERLSTLFVNAMGVQQFTRSFAIWHTTRNDYSKRKLLRAALENLPHSEMGKPIKNPDGTLMRNPDGSFTGVRLTLVDEITWILDAADKLEGARDDSAHTPLRYASLGDLLSLAELITTPDPPTERVVMAQDGFANPRATRLRKSNRDLLIEYRYARDRILILRDYAVAIEHTWSNPPLPWPDRPSLPERRPSRRSKGAASHQKQK